MVSDNSYCLIRQNGGLEMQLSRTQIGVGAGIAGAATLTLAAFVSPILPHVTLEQSSTIRLWLACSLMTTIWLLFGVACLARHRFHTPADIGGAGLNENSSRATLMQAIIQNTLEQTVLAIIAYGAWIWLGPPDRMGLVIVFTVFFSIGRLLFMFGYVRGASGRALGFGLTFYPSVALLLGALPAALSHLATP
jgi:MAPEG family